MYDSTKDTRAHIDAVRKLLFNIKEMLTLRAVAHDASKLEQPEKGIFDVYTPRLKGTTYGSDEYKEFLEEMRVGLDHHYEKNTHHPEHFPNGISGMNLIDLIEMFCDWKAATERHDDGDLHKSIGINKERFGYDDVLASIFHNTARLFESGAPAESALRERAIVAAAYWLDCSPHERTEEDGIVLARYARASIERIVALEAQLPGAQG